MKTPTQLARGFVRLCTHADDVEAHAKISDAIRQRDEAIRKQERDAILRWFGPRLPAIDHRAITNGDHHD